MIPYIIIILYHNDTTLNRTKHKTYLNTGTMQQHLVVYVTRFAKTRHNDAFLEIQIFA